MSRVVLFGGLGFSILRFRGHLIRSLVNRGHEVTVLAPTCPEELVAQLRGLGCHFVGLPFDRAGLSMLRQVTSFVAVVKALRSCRPDVILAFNTKPLILGLLAARLVGIKRRYGLVTGLGFAFSCRRETVSFLLIRSVIRKLYQLALGGAQAVIFQNVDDRAALREAGIVSERSTMYVVNGSGIDLDEFTPQKLPDTPRFLMVARLIRDKGLMEYLEATRMVKVKYPDVSFRLAGDFDQNPTAIKPDDLHPWIADGSIDYLGFCSDIREAIADVSVVVLPSYREGTPRSLLEAMAMGRAIITTDVPGCRETVQDGRNGRLVAAANAAALASAMCDLIDNRNRIAEYGRESRRMAQERYDVVKVNAEMLRIMGL